MKIRLFTIPNLLTLSNLLCGAAAILATLGCGDLTAAFWFIAAAALFDFFDGMAARLLGQSGPLGVQLDSLADDISFGLAPSFVLLRLFDRMNAGALPDWAGWGVFLFAACAALRLAKFNIDETQHAEFCGLPTPAATLVVVSLGLLSECGGLTVPAWAVLLVAAALAALMVSPIRMFALKFRGFGLRGNGLRYGFLACAALLLLVLRLRALPAIVLLYVLLSCARTLFRRDGKR